MPLKALTPWVKRLVLRVHPDVMSTRPQEIVDQNESSLAELFRFLDLVSQRVDGGAQGGGGGGSGNALKPRYDFSFFFESRSRPAGQPEAPFELKRMSVDVHVPPFFEERMRIMEGKGLGPQVRANWLSFAAVALQRLCKAAELDVRFALAPDVAALVTEGSEAGSGPGGKRGKAAHGTLSASSSLRPANATAALLANLAKHSPLVQGKGVPFPRRGTMGGSVFPAAERRKRADALLARAGRITLAPGLPPAEAVGAVARLRAALVDHYDALQAYNSLWDQVRIAIVEPAPRRGDRVRAAAEGDGDGGGGGGGGGGYHADAPSLRFAVPADFTAERLVALVEASFPRMLSSARGELRKGKNAGGGGRGGAGQGKT